MAAKTKPSCLRILIVDDHFYVRLGLAASLNCEPDMEVVAEAANATEALQLYRKKQPDLAILDYELPGQNGIELTAALIREFPAARVLLLSIHAGEEDVFRATKAGALAARSAPTEASSATATNVRARCTLA
ncbi:MAG: response regulator transcription factor, partial [Verrucomicrobia bacterium]|nr:response regulator transcription factor [Verrucomicrobiota bacterium]